MSADLLIRKALERGVVLRLVAGKVKLIGKREAVDELLGPLRQHKADLIRWLNQPASNDLEPHPGPSNWREFASEYHEHHFNCPTCIAAGRGSQYGQRCGAGMALWMDYQHEFE